MVLRAEGLRDYYRQEGQEEAAEIMDDAVARMIAIGLPPVLEIDDGFNSVRALRTGAYLHSKKLEGIVEKLHGDDAKTVARFLRWALRNIVAYENDSLAHLCMPDQLGHRFNMCNIYTIPKLRTYLESYDPKNRKHKLKGIGPEKTKIARKALAEFDELLQKKS